MGVADLRWARYRAHLKTRVSTWLVNLKGQYLIFKKSYIHDSKTKMYVGKPSTYFTQVLVQIYITSSVIGDTHLWLRWARQPLVRSQNTRLRWAQYTALTLNSLVLANFKMGEFLTLFHMAPKIVLIHMARGPWDPPLLISAPVHWSPSIFFLWSVLDV